MQTLITQKYILRDAINRRKLKKYVQKIIRTTKNIEKTNIQNQLNLIYNDININVRVDDLRRSKTKMILNELLSDLNKFKYD